MNKLFNVLIVAALLAVQCSDKDDPQSDKEEIPAAPRGLVAVPGDGMIILSWDSIPGVTSYKVYRGGTVVGTPWGSSFSDGGLTNGTAYTYEVSAVNDVGEGLKSNTVTATPLHNPTAVIYLDAINGNDTYSTNSSTQPWKTMDKARASVHPGMTVILRSGNYGSVSFNNSDHFGTNWTDAISYKADPSNSNADVRFELLKIEGGGPKYLIFEGIRVQPLTRMGPAVEIKGKVQHVVLRRMEVHAYANDYKDDTGASGFYIEGTGSGMEAENIVVEECNVHNIYNGLDAIFVKNIQVRKNDFHEIVSSAVRFWDDSKEILIEGNRIYNQRAEWGTDPHGSGISLRSRSHVTVRNNTIHDYGTSRAIRVYGIGEAHHDFLFENNLVYNPLSNAVEFVDTGDNFVVRNNTFVDDMNVWFFEGHDGSGFHFYNNIVSDFIIAEEPGERHMLKAHEGNNIVKTVIRYYPGGFWENPDEITASSNSIILKKSTQGAGYFTTGLFADYTTRNFYLRSGSIAVNFGDLVNASASDLEGRARNGAPDAGCFEMQ